MSTRKINVIDSKPVNSGTSTSGVPWTLYEVIATKPDGEPIDLKLKSFEKLDGLVDVEVEEQKHEKYGVSYMLKKAGAADGRSAGARLGPKVDELRQRIEMLEAAVEFLRNQVSSLMHSPPPARAPSQAPPAPAAEPASTFGDPEDIPF